MTDFKLTTDIPYIGLTGELWGVYHKNFGESWRRYHSTALYVAPEQKKSFEWNIFPRWLLLAAVHNQRDSFMYENRSIIRFVPTCRHKIGCRISIYDISNRTTITKSEQSLE